MASRYNSHDSPTITAGAVVAMSATLIAVVKVSALYSKWYKKFIVSEPISTSLSQLRRTKSRRASTCGNAQGLNAMTPINQDQKTSAAGGTPVTRVFETTLLLAQKHIVSSNSTYGETTGRSRGLGTNDRSFGKDGAASG